MLWQGGRAGAQIRDGVGQPGAGHVPGGGGDGGACDEHVQSQGVGVMCMLPILLPHVFPPSLPPHPSPSTPPPDLPPPPQTTKPQTGAKDPAMRQMRTLLRRYPDFVDVRAALAAALWASGETRGAACARVCGSVIHAVSRSVHSASYLTRPTQSTTQGSSSTPPTPPTHPHPPTPTHQGKEGEAETTWERVEDPRYRDVAWLAAQRRWPPSLVGAMDALLKLKSV